MEIALLINERAIREAFVAGIGGENVGIKEYSTAADALREFLSKRFDLIVLDWKIYPGYGCSDVEIRELATLIPVSPGNENLLYWQVALRVIDNIRSEESQNVRTPVIFRFPQLPELYVFGMGDDLTKETISTDLKGKGLIETIYGVNMKEFIELARKRMVTTKREVQ